jgi:hypothetical protein
LGEKSHFAAPLAQMSAGARNRAGGASRSRLLAPFVSTSIAAAASWAPKHLNDAGRIVFLANESEKLMFAHQGFFLRRNRQRSTIFPVHFKILGNFLSFRFELIAESEG